MRAALVAHYSGAQGQARSAAEVFAEIDTDGSGTLDREEMATATATLGLLMDAEEIEAGPCAPGAIAPAAAPVDISRQGPHNHIGLAWSSAVAPWGGQRWRRWTPMGTGR